MLAKDIHLGKNQDQVAELASASHDQIAFVPLWRLVAKDLASTGGGARESLTG